jgi:hypothetical protein
MIGNGSCSTCNAKYVALFTSSYAVQTAGSTCKEMIRSSASLLNCFQCVHVCNETSILYLIDDYCKSVQHTELVEMSFCIWAITSQLRHPV